jgi:hypothetical protein
MLTLFHLVISGLDSAMNAQLIGLQIILLPLPHQR